MSDDLNVQTPGETPDVDADKIAKLQASKADDVITALTELSDAELNALALAERQSTKPKPRAGVLRAIDTEIASREADAGLGQTIQGNSDANLGDRERYATMHAHEVDPSQIPVPVLTLDGWVLPLPKAEG